MTFELPDLRVGYVALCRTVARTGRPVEVRGQATRELTGVSLRIDDPADVLPVGVGRKLNPAIGVAEALQLMGGFTDPELMVALTPTFRQFLNGGVLHGAYGPRLRPQLPNVLHQLQTDETSRQAVVTLWDPLFDQQEGLRDRPCTIALQWLLRDDKLEAHTHMRSNDVWWGLTYDVYQFTRLQYLLAEQLDVEVGRYHHHAVSLHAYERDLEGIEGLHSSGSDPKDVRQAGSGLPHNPDDWALTREAAEDVVYLPDREFWASHGYLHANPVTNFYRHALRGYRARKKEPRG